MSQAWDEAKKNLAGGVNSPVRAFKAVGGEPIFFEKGFGPYLYDITGKEYIDYCMSWGALLLGHANEKVIKAIQEQSVKGTSFGAATEYETRLASCIKKAFPNIQKLRFTSSGTEAAMSAIRLARGFTNREKILKFDGCYHGHADSLLVKAGSGLATFGTPDSGGVPKALAQLTAVLPYNDVAALKEFFNKNHDIACVIVEPVAGNMGVVPATKEFLETLRDLTSKHKTLLIFDEVISGFRVGYGGAEHLYGITPDLTVLGKVIGGGLPIGAFGGRANLMDALSPTGAVYQAGTLSGNPLSMAAGLAMLESVSPNFYNALNQKTAHFLAKAKDIFKKRKKRITIQSVGSMFTLFFSPKPVLNFSDTRFIDTKEFARSFQSLAKNGIYTPPSAFESSFISGAHTEHELNKTLSIFKKW